MKQTLLEMVQSLLASMDSDEVNSITDTVESYDLAILLRDLYYEMVVELNLPEHTGLFELTASTTTTKPTLMTVPTSVSRLDWIKYDHKTITDTNSRFEAVYFSPFQDFLTRQQSLQNETSDVGTMDVLSNGEVFPIMYKTNEFPTCYTTIGDNQLIFDSYNIEVDDTLQKSKTMCFGVFYPTFNLVDTFTPSMDATQFPYFLNRAKERAFVEKKQITNEEAKTSARRQKIVLQKRKYKTPTEAALMTTPRYGRK